MVLSGVNNQGELVMNAVCDYNKQVLCGHFDPVKKCL